MTYLWERKSIRREETIMRDIKNCDGRLVAKLDELSDTIVIQLKGYETQIIRKSDGSYEIVNTSPNK